MIGNVFEFWRKNTAENSPKTGRKDVIFLRRKNKLYLSKILALSKSLSVRTKAIVIRVFETKTEV